MTFVSYCPFCYKDIDPQDTGCDNCGWNEIVCDRCENILEVGEQCACDRQMDAEMDERGRDEDDGRTYADPRDYRDGLE